MKSNTAAKLYLDVQGSNDLGLTLLRLIESTKGENISEIVNEYTSLVAGLHKVAQITTSRDLDVKQKEAVQSKVSSLFETLKLLFVFTVDELVEGGIQIQVGDDKINF